MIILFTDKNPASRNIANMLIENNGFVKASENEWKRNNIRMINTHAPTVLDVPTNFETDLLLVLSTHKSKNGGKMLTAHFPGNWGNADFGGEARTLNIAYGSKIKILINELIRSNSQNWPVSMEVDHHGPLSAVPIMFVEIGSTENEWSDSTAAKDVANAVSNFIEKYNQPDYKTVLGFGGGHYAREFTKILTESEIAVGHIAPKYVIDSIDEKLFHHAVERNVEKIEDVFILKKGTNSSQKKKIIKLCESAGLDYHLVNP